MLALHDMMFTDILIGLVVVHTERQGTMPSERESAHDRSRLISLTAVSQFAGPEVEVDIWEDVAALRSNGCVNTDGLPTSRLSEILASMTCR